MSVCPISNSFSGKDGTQGFEDVGHSEDARKMLEDLQVGVLAEVRLVIVLAYIVGGLRKEQESGL
jgi:hypothetical protein